MKVFKPFNFTPEKYKMKRENLAPSLPISFSLSKGKKQNPVIPSRKKKKQLTHICVNAINYTKGIIFLYSMLSRIKEN